MRNAYSPNPGEYLVGNELEKHGWTVYLPARDVGIDLLVERGGNVMRVQVKESRVYDNVANPEIGWSSWTQLAPTTLEKAADQGVDWFVFVVYALGDRGRRLRFDIFYVVIDPGDLESRLRAYHPEQDRTVYWHRDREGQLWEVRGMTAKAAGASFRTTERNFTAYLNNWSMPSPPTRQ